MPAVIFPSGFPCHDVGDPGRDILIAPRANVELGCPASAHLAYQEFDTKPIRDAAGAKISSPVFRQLPQFGALVVVAPRH